MENKTIAIPDIKQLTRSEIESKALSLIEGVQNGYEDAFELDIKLKFLEETIKEAREKISEQLKKKDTFDNLHGVKVSKRNGYALLDYSKDSVYCELEKQLNERKELLKNAHVSKHMIVTEEGEVIEKVPVKSYVKDSISYTFPK